MSKNGVIGELAEQATRLEESGDWAEAAKIWQRIASHKNASKKSRSEAKGRAAAARTRAANANRDAKPDAPAVETTSDEAVENDLQTEEETAPSEPADAPNEEVAPSTPPISETPPSEPDASAQASADSPLEKTRELPPLGSVIQKRDRKGELRCECKVVEGGIEYNRVTYKSLSSAALAASKDLGLGASTLDGWAWWGLKTKSSSAGPRAPKANNAATALERAFAKYRDKAAAVVQSAAGDDRTTILNTLKAQSAELIALSAPEGSDS